MPLHAGHGPRVVLGGGHGLTVAAELPQVPDLTSNTIIAPSTMNGYIPVPIDDIQRLGVGTARKHAGLTRLSLHGPRSYGLVTAAARHHRLLIWTPLGKPPPQLRWMKASQRHRPLRPLSPASRHDVLVAVNRRGQGRVTLAPVQVAYPHPSGQSRSGEGLYSWRLPSLPGMSSLAED